MASIRLGLRLSKRNVTGMEFIKASDDMRIAMAHVREKVKGDADLEVFASLLSFTLSKDLNRMTKKILDAMEYEGD